MEDGNKIIVYGCDWCGDTRRAKRVFNENNIDYIYVDIDHDKEAEQLVKKTNNGNRSVPTIFFPDNTTLTEPGREQLKQKIRELSLIQD